MPLEDLITSTVIFQSPPLGLPSLTIPLVAAVLTTDQNTAWTAEYGAAVDVVSLAPSTWVAALEVLGVTAGEDLYEALTDMFSQRVNGQQSAPSEFLLARRATPVAMVRTVSFGAQVDGDYTVTINGVDFTTDGTGNTNAEIVTELVALINAGTEPVTAADGAGDTVVLTADEAGVPFTSAVEHETTPAAISIATTTANVGIGTDIADWRLQDDRWYFFLETTRSSGVIRYAAETLEALSRNRIGVFQTDDADAQDGGSTDDLASVLGSAGLGLTRSALVWNDDDNEFIDFALVGKMCGFLPGDPNWVHQSLASVSGIQAPELTSTTALETKRYTFLEVYGAPVPPQTSTRGGRMLDGNWIDIVHLVDDLNMRIQIREYEALLNQNTPYFGGEATVEASLRGALMERAGPLGSRTGALAEETIVVTVPAASDQDEADRLARRYDDVTWSATAKGKVNLIANVGSLEQ